MVEDLAEESCQVSLTESNSRSDGKKGAQKKKVVDLNSIASAQKEADNTGLVYMSRVPPYMPPSQVKHLLSKYGEIGRIYLVPETEIHARRRRKYKKDRRVRYVEGWIEFHNKSVAKKVCRHLNGTLLNVKKRSSYRDDLWNLKYLPRFKWNDLTSQIIYENRMRRQRLRAEISREKKENAIYIQNVENSRIISKIEERKKLNSRGSTDKVPAVHRKFKQRTPRSSEEMAMKDYIDKDIGVISNPTIVSYLA